MARHKSKKHRFRHNVPRASSKIRTMIRSERFREYEFMIQLFPSIHIGFNVDDPMDAVMKGIRESKVFEDQKILRTRCYKGFHNRIYLRTKNDLLAAQLMHSEVIWKIFRLVDEK